MSPKEHIIILLTITHTQKPGRVQANELLINSGEIMDSILHTQIYQRDDIQKFDLLDMSATYKAKILNCRCTVREQCTGGDR
jgi:hypothetical protein